ncbi:UNVERIFIED_CONTAM: protein SLOW GREEN 1, chloroplastic [Sesamum angustifolium]|uniref:Protein SLOW GREEN 1, chloroplastic n=1 Tax=Sesamum angustifolium TaxID=2727405 RepID=A0AAW2N3J3_9LAMI
MNTLNLVAAKPTGGHLPLTPSLNPYRPSFSKPFSSLSFRSPPPPLRQLSLSPTKASLQDPNRRNSSTPPELFKFQVSNRNATPGISSIPFLGPLRATVVTTITAAALFFTGFGFHFKPCIAQPISPPPTVETAEKDAIVDEEREKSLEEHLLSNPYDVDGLKNLMEIKIKSKKIPEAIEILDKLMELEPEEVEWPMMRAHLYAYNGELELAKNGFNELLMKDPFRVEAYHGLVTVASQEESSKELGDIEKRIEEAMKLCKKENKKSDLRDFKLLLAQIRVLEGRYDDALKVYQELVKEEPRDFRPYLCQGIIYTLLRKNGEAEKNFEKYRRLVPKGHPYASYFDDNTIATKLFAQKVENQRAMAKS